MVLEGISDSVTEDMCQKLCVRWSVSGSMCVLQS